MSSWRHQEDLLTFPGMLAYPDGEVDPTETRLRFTFDYNRHDVIFVDMAIPPAVSGDKP